MLLRTAAFKKSHLDFGNEDSAFTEISSVMRNNDWRAYVVNVLTQTEGRVHIAEECGVERKEGEVSTTAPNWRPLSRRH